MTSESTSAENALNENEVSREVVKYLNTLGYTARSLTAGQQGIDIAAFHPETHHRWAIEAKGATSSMENSARFGAPSSNATAYRAVAHGLLTAVSWTNINEFKDTSIGLALPNDEYFNPWLDNIESACSVLGIVLFRVSRGCVCCSAEMAVRPPSLLRRSRPMPLSLRRNFEGLPTYEGE